MNNFFLDFNLQNRKVLIFLIFLFFGYYCLLNFGDSKIDKDKSSIYLAIISLFLLFFSIVYNKILSKRIVVLLMLLLLSFRIFYLLFNQEYTQFEVFLKISSELPAFFIILLFNDIISLYQIKNKSSIAKKVHKEYNWTEKRINDRSFSFRNCFLNNNGLNPILTYIIIVFYSMMIISIYILNINIIYPLLAIFVFFFLFVKKDRVFTSKILTLSVFFICIGSSFVFCNLYYKNINNPLEELDSGSGNNTYAKTRIGGDQKLKGDFQKLLFRANWKDRKTNLLPTSYYNFFNEKDSSWLLSSKLKNYEIVKNNGNIVNLKKPEELKVASFDFIKVENLNEFLTTKEETYNNPSYKFEKVKKDPKIISIIGSFGKEDKNIYPLPMPHNPFDIMSDNIVNNPIYQYTSGSISVLGSTGFKEFNIFYQDYDNDQYDLIKPIKEDLSYPKKYQEDIINLINKADIKETDDTDLKVTKLVNYFQSNYLYTLKNNYKNTDSPRELSDFLNDDNRGHCEYFATSMTLALRELGIPTRYTVGFLVNENNKDEGEDLYWVRSKDAHAWATYWNGQAWKTADATPYNSEEFNQFGKASILKDKMEEWKFMLNNINFDFEEYYDLIKGGVVFFVLSTTILFFFLRKRSKNNTVYLKDPNLKRLKRKIRKYEKIYPNLNNDLYLTWALKTNNEELIKIIKEYYKRYE